LSKELSTIKPLLLNGFIDLLKNAHYDHRFVFFLGAGCSRSSGIPTASELVNNRWMTKLRKLYPRDYVDERFPNYDEMYAANYYGNVFETLYPHPEGRQREIEEVIGNSFPSIGYVILAQLMSHETHGRKFHLILTTNFDDLIQDALFLYANRKPLVVTHESLISFVHSKSIRPTVIKLHGDARIAPKNSELETGKLEDEVEHKVVELLKDTGIIFMGYGGNDKSIMRILNKLTESDLSGGIFWINSHLPHNQEMKRWLVSKSNAYWVTAYDFDDVMMKIYEEMLDFSFLERKELGQLIANANKHFFASLFNIFRSHSPDAGKEQFMHSIVEDWRTATPSKQRSILESLKTDEEHAYFEQYVAQNNRKAEDYYIKTLSGGCDHSDVILRYLRFLFESYPDRDALRHALKEAMAAGVDINSQARKDGLTGLMIAAREGCCDIVQLLIENGAVLDIPALSGKTALRLAAGHGQLSIVKLLIDHGANVNLKDIQGYSPLHAAATAGFLEIVKFLIQHDADINSTIWDGGTTLMGAAYNGHVDIVVYLLENGVDANKANNYGTTALIWAAHKGELEIVKLLLDAGADVNVKNNFGKTALMEGVLNGHKEVVEVLLERGADISARSNDGKTALVQATERKFIDIAEMLIHKVKY
jgi:ankyrin repeat protein